MDKTSNIKKPRTSEASMIRQVSFVNKIFDPLKTSVAMVGCPKNAIFVGKDDILVAFSGNEILTHADPTQCLTSLLQSMDADSVFILQSSPSIGTVQMNLVWTDKSNLIYSRTDLFVKLDGSYHVGEYVEVFDHPLLNTVFSKKSSIH